MAASKPNPTIICNRCDQLAEKDSRYLNCNASRLTKGELCNMCIHDNKPGCDHITQTKATRDRTAADRVNGKANDPTQALHRQQKRQEKKAKYLTRVAENALVHNTILHQTELEELRRKCVLQRSDLDMMEQASLESATLKAEYEALRKTAAEDKSKYYGLCSALPGMLGNVRVAATTNIGGMRDQIPLPSIPPPGYLHNTTYYRPASGSADRPNHSTDNNRMPPSQPAPAPSMQGRGSLFGSPMPNMMLSQRTHNNAMIEQAQKGICNIGPVPTQTQQPLTACYRPQNTYNNTMPAPAPAPPMHSQLAYNGYHGGHNTQFHGRQNDWQALQPHAYTQPPGTRSNAIAGQAPHTAPHHNTTTGFLLAQAEYWQPYGSNNTVSAPLHGGYQPHMAAASSGGQQAHMMPQYQPYQPSPPASTRPAFVGAPSRAPPPPPTHSSQTQWSYDTQQQPQQQWHNQQAQGLGQGQTFLRAATNAHPIPQQGGVLSSPPQQPYQWR